MVFFSHNEFILVFLCQFLYITGLLAAKELIYFHCSPDHFDVVRVSVEGGNVYEVLAVHLLVDGVIN